MKSLYGEISNLKNRRLIRFHMPGHKGKDIWRLGDIFALDFTEISGVDNFHFPKGEILQAEKEMARAYGADMSFFLVNGSSSGVMAAAMAFREQNVICAGNSHVSLYKGLFLAKSIPVYIMPETVDQMFCAGIPFDALDKTLAASGAKAVFITSPTYEGICLDIAKIAEIAHSYNAVLIVDEAHGAHLKYNDSFPPDAITQGADIAIQSHHKTLAVLGQGAVLHIKGGAVDHGILKRNINLLTTTSPSFPIMISLDRNREMLELKGKQIYNEYIGRLEKFRSHLKKLKHLSLFDPNPAESLTIKGIDISRITVIAPSSGKRLEKFLYEEHNISIEMATADYIVLLSSFVDSDEDFSAAEKALFEFDSSLSMQNFSFSVQNRQRESPIRKLGFLECFGKPSALIEVDLAIDKVSADFITPYPPGIPLLSPGELFTEEITNEIKNLSENCDVIGTKIEEGRIFVSIIV